jgi:hypothetical protein
MSSIVHIKLSAQKNEDDLDFGGGGLSMGVFGRAPRGDSLLNSAGALPNSF